MWFYLYKSLGNVNKLNHMADAYLWLSGNGGVAGSGSELWWVTECGANKDTYYLDCGDGFMDVHICKNA